MFLLFFIAWIIFNGAVTLEIVLFGIGVSAAAFLFICRFMDYSLKKEVMIMKKLPAAMEYLWTLVKEILAANFSVIRLILTDREEIKPAVVRVPTSLQTKLGRLILANSITLTPGTITVSLGEQELLVHCLDESMSEGMDDSVFTQKLGELEKMDR